MRNARQRAASCRGFTLLELVMAVMILSIMMILSFFCFDAVVQSWHAGMEMSDSLGQADHVMEQVVSGLRSAYYPATGTQLDEYGFQFSDGGEGPEARDGISWVKIGRALVGEECTFADSPHRINVYVDDGAKSDSKGLAITAWRVDLQPEEFEPEKDVTPISLSPRVIGLNCRMLDKDQPMKDDKPNWQDEWKFSNSIPKAVEITLYMEPADKDSEPLEMQRIVEIPMFDLSQNPRKQGDSGKGPGGAETRTGLGGRVGTRTGSSGVGGAGTRTGPGNAGRRLPEANGTGRQPGAGGTAPPPMAQ